MKINKETKTVRECTSCSWVKTAGIALTSVRSMAGSPEVNS